MQVDVKNRATLRLNVWNDTLKLNLRLLSKSTCIYNVDVSKLILMFVVDYKW